MAFCCDTDFLLIQVEQIGQGACHTGMYSCFGDEHGHFHAMEHVQHQINERETHPREKSYTNYLLAEGVDKICKKIGEEATEMILAAKNNDKDSLVGEVADYLYHAMVLMHTQGIEWRDVMGELSKRHQIKGNLKDKNQKGGY